MSNLNHFNSSGNAHMVDISEKSETKRIAVASGKILMQQKTLDLVKDKSSKKGDVIAVARIAAIQACKKAPDLVPLCHLINISRVDVSFEFVDYPPSIACTVQVESLGKTGVEIESLVGTQVGLITIYDMLKSVDRGMIITDIGLLLKDGGKSGKWERKVR
ncbi:MAG: cyclic pyranopterin monophosphate synthase MoaC [Betaproteobacteria bacterium TMED82]|nr:MAG: cyclic pyranopterin monophosphate synthase MoaC [Betaproteobacteria bacterium TMED82]|tara:strand:+ start:68318 stop:68800 length:483 start_codon:yes stop_codon:yes gene_type:complete